jgi:glycosyltransferase involved in cell wall biosynthesis
MIAAWSLRSLIDKPDVLIIGTDPVMSALTVLPWKLTQSRTKAIHWCFDLYPEAALAAGIIRPGVAASLLRSLVGSAYKRFDLIADIGDCMRERISLYKSPAKQTTLAPWALAEPASALPIDVEERKAIFGNASLGLMYSGNFGRPHSYGGLLTLARAMRDADAHFALSIRGNRASEFQHAVRTDDHNVSFVPFAPQEHLEKRLSAADIQIISLRNEWTGTVVPSKFFGALAAGRPVLFFGSERSYISRTIRNHQLGWVCSPGNERTVAAELRAVAQNPSSLKELSERCHRVYCETFARDLVLDRFDRELRALLGEAAAEQIKDFAETTASVPLQS